MPRRVDRAQRQGNLLWVRAAVGVNGGEPITLRLLVDTGSSFTVLPTAVVEDLGCNLSQLTSRIAIFAASGRLMTPIVTVPRARLFRQARREFSSSSIRSTGRSLC